jgi:hypothetical protein
MFDLPPVYVVGRDVEAFVLLEIGLWYSIIDEKLTQVKHHLMYVY